MLKSKLAQMTKDENVDFDYRKIDELLHSRIRLVIISILARVEKTDFTFLKEQVKTSDGNLSVQCRKLEKAGYILSKKTFVDRKPITYFSISSKGKKALWEYSQKLANLTLDIKE